MIAFDGYPKQLPRNRPPIPFIPKKQRDTFAQQQNGGFAFAPIIAAATAAYKLGEKIKPGTKLKNFLDSDSMNGHRDGIGYKIANGAANVMKSIGWGLTSGYPTSTDISTPTTTPSDKTDFNGHKTQLLLTKVRVVKRKKNTVKKNPNRKKTTVKKNKTKK